MARLIAVLLLLIPGALSATGIKLMRDSLFDQNYSFLLYHGILQFIVGLILFVGGLSFIAGFIVHRDRKKNLVKKGKKKAK